MDIKEISLSISQEDIAAAAASEHTDMNLNLPTFAQSSTSEASEPCG